MTRVGDFGDTMQKDAVPAVSSDVIFDSSRFPNYRIGANNQTVEGKDDRKVLSMKEVVARETAQLLDQQNRLSIRDLASKFEKGLAAAAKLSEEARLREEASLEKHALLKKLRDALESLKGRVAGKNKEDVVDAISMENHSISCELSKSQHFVGKTKPNFYHGSSSLQLFNHSISRLCYRFFLGFLEVPV